MKKYMRMLRKGDILIIFLLMAGSFLPLGIFSAAQARTDGAEVTATVAVDGEVLKEFVLADDGQTETYVYEDEDGHTNTIVREGDQIFISDANCNDQLCVKMPPISKNGQTIVCLPHHLIVEVDTDGGNADEGGLDIVS